MKELKHKFLTSKYTTIFHEGNPKFGAPHHFVVVPTNEYEDMPTAKVDFQEGPIKENDVNGIANEDALIMVLVRLEGFQQTEYACDENARAIAGIEAALVAMRERTDKRVVRDVEGTSTI